MGWAQKHDPSSTLEQYMFSGGVTHSKQASGDVAFGEGLFHTPVVAFNCVGAEEATHARPNKRRIETDSLRRDELVLRRGQVGYVGIATIPFVSVHAEQ